MNENKNNHSDHLEQTEMQGVQDQVQIPQADQQAAQGSLIGQHPAQGGYMPAIALLPRDKLHTAQPI